MTVPPQAEAGAASLHAIIARGNGTNVMKFVCFTDPDVANAAGPSPWTLVTVSDS